MSLRDYPVISLPSLPPLARCRLPSHLLRSRCSLLYTVQRFLGNHRSSYTPLKDMFKPICANSLDIDPDTDDARRSFCLHTGGAGIFGNVFSHGRAGAGALAGIAPSALVQCVLRSVLLSPSRNATR